jgi:hypothetical protein
MLYREPEYRRRRRQKDVENHLYSKEEAKEAAQAARIAKIETSIEAIGQQIATYADENSPANKAKVRREKWEIGSLISAAVVGLIAIFVSNSDAADQRKTMGQQLDVMQADQRAWVAPVVAVLDEPISVGKPIKYGIQFQNTGKQPGLDGNILLEFSGFIEAPTEGKTWFDNVPRIPNTVCQRTPTIPGYLAIYPTYNSSPMSHFTSAGPIDLQPIIDGKRSFFVQGCYTYKTVGKPHSSAFCFFLEPDTNKPSDRWSFKFCPGGNDAN